MMGCLEHDEVPPSAAEEPVDNGEARSERAKAVEETPERLDAERGKKADSSEKSEKPAKEVKSKGKPKKGRPNNVKKMRIERMMSKAELARRADLSVLTVDRVEKGFGCRMNTKRKILEALNLSLADRVRVFGEEE